MRRKSSQVTPTAAVDSAEATRVRRRVQRLVDISARVGTYRDGLDDASQKLSDHEATIIGDLERYGLDLLQLEELLRGGHVLVDAPDLYEKWRFPKSRERLSSHHKTIDKAEFPDLGFKGPLVREKLHGRTATGTWVQLEKTPAAMGHGFKLPTYHDVLHLWDFIVYRVTKSNVGPWGLSKQTERRPMYLAPSMVATVPVPARAQAELLGALEAIEDADDQTSAAPDLAHRFPAPERKDTLAELQFLPGNRNGRGLFGASEVHIKAAPRTSAHDALDAAHRVLPQWELPDAGTYEPITVTAGRREIRTVVRRLAASEQQEDT
ncbi:hypothetical protein [Demetria terragena]|uniref:hypothetical protein n=1 Tax=Demetria terragena TaxID=63959 RepID=UPI0003A36486|nr:hypothetical protein [Demetria terragena]